MRYAYPYELVPQPEGGFTVTFPDVPEAITQGETAAEAASMAEDALVTALSFYTDNFEPLPQASPAQGCAVASIPALAAAKLALHEAMIEAGMSDAALADQLGVNGADVRRLRDPLRQSRIAEIEAALRVLGKRLGIVVEAA
jgi:antitoxin HicB